MAESNKAHGSPTKDFFIRMITKDISLIDCILDLLDNSIDGARRQVGRSGDLEPFHAEIFLDSQKFEIADNCGGISLSDAIDYAFHFGRRKDAKKDVDGGIGLYGIGMKRAIFKMGRNATVESQHHEDAFIVYVDVDAWEDSSEWDFNIESLEESPQKGTKISLRNLYPNISAAFADLSFSNELVRTIARDYAFVMQQGFKISVAELPVPAYAYEVKSGPQISPAVVEYEDEGVSVRIVVGLMRELENEIPEELRPTDTDRFGWYVVCNDRVVVAGDKTDLTVWGNQGFNVWHGQYNGFGGFLFLNCDDPARLPWTTTKREVDASDPIYLRAVVRMKDLTDQFIKYTGARKADPQAAYKAEHDASPIDVRKATGDSKLKFPAVVKKESGPEMVTVSYQRPKADVKEVAAALDDFAMSAREVGIRTFEYFRRMELGK